MDYQLVIISGFFRVLKGLIGGGGMGRIATTYVPFGATQPHPLTNAHLPKD
jgi:hypothetical protein